MKWGHKLVFLLAGKSSAACQVHRKENKSPCRGQAVALAFWQEGDSAENIGRFVSKFLCTEHAGQFLQVHKLEGVLCDSSCSS